MMIQGCRWYRIWWWRLSSSTTIARSGTRWTNTQASWPGWTTCRGSGRKYLKDLAEASVDSDYLSNTSADSDYLSNIWSLCSKAIQVDNWSDRRYEQYFADVTTSAKALIELGLEQHRSVDVIFHIMKKDNYLRTGKTSREHWWTMMTVIIIVPADIFSKGGGAGSKFSRMVFLRCWGCHGRRIGTRRHCQL